MINKLVISDSENENMNVGGHNVASLPVIQENMNVGIMWLSHW